jgi:hypothetical protein
MSQLKDRFLETLKLELLPYLRETGFSGRNWDLRRVRGHFVDCLNLQVMRDGASCCVNMGVHPKSIPVANDETLPDPATLDPSQCVVQARLARRGEGSRTSHWWSFGDSNTDALASARDLVSTYRAQGEQFFGRYTELPGPFSYLTLKVLDNTEAQMAWVSPGIFGLTAPGLALFLARLHESLGDRSRACEFAEWGLARLPKVLPRKAFLAVLKKLSCSVESLRRRA